MPALRTILLAAVGLALPAGLAVAVYLSSAGTIAASPSRPALAGQTIAKGVRPAKRAPHRPKRERKQPQAGAQTDDRGGSSSGSTSSSSGRTTVDDHGGDSGSSGSSASSGSPGSSGSSGSSGPSGSSGSGSSGSGSGDD